MNSSLMEIAVSEGVTSSIEELNRLFTSGTVRPRELSTATYRAKQLAHTHQSAELNLAIAVAIELCSPAHPLNARYAGSYRYDARQCLGYSLELEMWYMELQLSALRQWVSASNEAVGHHLRNSDLSITRTKRELDELRALTICVPRAELIAS